MANSSILILKLRNNIVNMFILIYNGKYVTAINKTFIFFIFFYLDNTDHFSIDNIKCSLLKKNARQKYSP